MKIAMLGAKAVPAIGGIAHYVEELGARLVDRGHEVTVYCRPHFLQDGSGPYRGMRRVVTRGLRGKHLDAATHSLTAALHARKEDFDILHIHGSAPGSLAPLLRRKGRGKVVVTIHGLDWQGGKWGRWASRTMYLAARIGARSADGLTAVSQVVRDQYQQLVGFTPVFIPTGVHLAEPVAAQELAALGVEPGRYVFCAARLVREKGVHYLVEAFAGLDTDLKLVIAGDCPYEDSYVQQLRAQASDRIIFAGYVTGRLLAELYSNAYVYVQPSEMEGLPIAVLEAMSYGRYVLASDIPANREALGPCGRTFKSRDVNALRTELAALLRQPEIIEAEFDRVRAYIRAERNWDLTADRFETLYQALATGDQVATS